MNKQSKNGNKSQVYVYNYLKKLFPDLIIILHHINSHKTDIEFNYYGNWINIEVKSCQKWINSQTRKNQCGKFGILQSELFKNDIFAFNILNHKRIRFVKAINLIGFLLPRLKDIKNFTHRLSEKQVIDNLEYFENFYDIINKYWSID